MEQEWNKKEIPGRIVLLKEEHTPEGRKEGR
jgi:hypothetical protein